MIGRGRVCRCCGDQHRLKKRAGGCRRAVVRPRHISPRMPTIPGDRQIIAILPVIGPGQSIQPARLEPRGMSSTRTISKGPEVSLESARRCRIEEPYVAMELVITLPMLPGYVWNICRIHEVHTPKATLCVGGLAHLALSTQGVEIRMCPEPVE